MNNVFLKTAIISLLSISVGLGLYFVYDSGKEDRIQKCVKTLNCAQDLPAYIKAAIADFDCVNQSGGKVDFGAILKKTGIGNCFDVVDVDFDGNSKNEKMLLAESMSNS